MKKLLGIMALLLLVMALLPACGGGEAGGGSSVPSEVHPSEAIAYTGFMQAAGGQWVKYAIPTSEGVTYQGLECIGKDTVTGKSCSGFEMNIEAGAEETIMQIWVDASTQEAVKYVAKYQDQVYCMNQVQQKAPAAGGEEGTPQDYRPDLPDIEMGTYTVPGNGKAIKVAKFKSSDGSEAWVSSEIPFGMVQALSPSGQKTMYLYDFGLSGAQRDITKAEMENCTSLPSSFPNPS
jgi:hypothetical protein